MDKKENSSQIMHDVSGSKNPFFSRKLLLVLVAVLLGLGSGFFLTRLTSSGGDGGIGGKLTNTETISKGQTFGSDDTTIYKDTTDGVLKTGGIGDEGQYHLVRPGGDAQNVYLTSSLVNLSKFIDRKIKVWGQTQKAQKAGWLMDVGKVKVLQ